jgi:hypothetical protein
VVAANHLDLLRPTFDKLDTDVNALVPPDAMKKTWTKFVADTGQITWLLDTTDRKAHAKDPTGVADFNTANRLGPTSRADAATGGQKNNQPTGGHGQRLAIARMQRGKRHECRPSALAQLILIDPSYLRPQIRIGAELIDVGEQAVKNVECRINVGQTIIALKR